MRTLVVGTGLVGSHIVRQLLTRGDDPVGFDRAPSEENLHDLRGRFALVTGDVLNLPSLIDTIRTYAIDRIINTVALVGPAAEAGFYEAFRVNVVGSVNVLEAARLSSVRRVVVYSSNAIFAPDRAGARFDEAAPKKPAGMNGAAKLCVEHVGEVYAQSHEMEVVHLRTGGIYGSGRSSGGVPQQLGDCARHIVRDMDYDFEKYVYLGRTDLIESRDAAMAGILACDVAGPPKLAYNIGNGEAFSYEELADAVRALYPERRIGVRDSTAKPVRVGDAPMDVSLAAADLGFKARYSFAQGFAELVDGLRVSAR